MKLWLRKLFEITDKLFNQAFTPGSNPMLQLGTMGWFFYWIVIVSGIYLYIFYDPGITQAYESVHDLTHEQWYAGGIMRSLHRYASDALVIVIFLHMLREFSMDRFHGPRGFTWVFGVATLWLLYASGITGFWIIWDRLAQYIAVSTTEWLDALPLFGESIARNFLHPGALSGRFFTLFVFIHIALPLFMLLLMWIHIQRITAPRVTPPRILAFGTLAILFLMSLISPVTSQEPANLATVPSVINLDWFYMFFYPLLDVYPGLYLWAVLFFLSGLLLVLPWLTTSQPGPAAKVDLDNCNGCGRCVSDCPYNAVSLQPRSDGLPFGKEAVVKNNLCVSCGICAGACPTATPFRRRSALVPGIELPDFSVMKLKNEILEQAKQFNGSGRIFIFGCDHGNKIRNMKIPNVSAISLPCIGMLPPSFLDLILSKDIADGVLLAGCHENNCFHRQGINWTEQRIARKRDPYLRDRVPREKINFLRTGETGENQMKKEIDSFRTKLDGV